MAAQPNDEPWRINDSRPSLRDAVAAKLGDPADLKSEVLGRSPFASPRTERTRAWGRLAFAAGPMIDIAAIIAAEVWWYYTFVYDPYLIF